jgi:hypothetical protein
MDTMCSVEDGSKHLRDCIERNCSNCGVSSIKFSNPELSKADHVPDLKWKTFEYIDIKTKHKEVKMYVFSKWYLQQQVVRSFRRVGLMKYGLHFLNVRCDTLTPGCIVPAGNRLKLV